VLRQDIEGRTVNKSGPACWMSPESIGKQVYSKKSDVWMFGVLGMSCRFFFLEHSNESVQK
jgi:serine/threonine protein kinase